MEMGLGQMGMNAAEFWDLTPREFQNKTKGFFDNQTYLQRQEWERARWMTVTLWNVQVDQKSRMDAKKFLPFEWEKKPPGELITQDELEKLKRYYGDKP